MIRKRFRSQPFGTRAYVSAIVLLGAAAIAHSVLDIATSELDWRWTIFAFLTLLSGSASIALPASASVSISETFVFTSAILFGPAVGTVIVALDAAVISFWSYRRGQAAYKIIFNICALPIAIWVGSSLFFYLAQVQPLFGTGSISVVEILAPLFIFTVVYFSLNSWIVTLAIALEKHVAPYPVWRDGFARLSLNYFGGASIAALFVAYSNTLDFGLGLGFFALVVPLLAILYFVFSTSSERVKDASRHLSELNNLYLSTIETLAMAIDAKDQITHGHIRRVQAFATGLAHRVGVDDPSMIKAIEAAALLHDMGKLAVPEYILNKPGPLTPAEFEKMKLHSSVGADILSSVNFPYPVVPIVRHHHENWNGTGYPDGLQTTEIPIGARILSVVDCFDALTSDRPYRPRLTDAAAIKILLERRGSMYDPLVVDAFVSAQAELQAEHEEQNFSDPGFEVMSQIHSSPSGTSKARDAGLSGISASSEESLAVYELTVALAGKREAFEIAETVSRTIRRVMPPSTCVVYLLDSDCDELVATYSSGEASQLFSQLRIGRGQRLSGWVAANLQTIVNSDPILDLGPTARTASPRLRSCLSTPIARPGGVVGVLTLYSSTEAAFNDDHRRVAELVAKHLCEALSNTSTPLVGQPSTGSAQPDDSRQAVVIVDMRDLRERLLAEPAKLEFAIDLVQRVVGTAVQDFGVSIPYDDERLVVVLNPTSSSKLVRISEVISDEMRRAAESSEASLSLVNVRPVRSSSRLTSLNELIESCSHPIPHRTEPAVPPIKRKSVH